MKRINKIIFATLLAIMVVLIVTNPSSKSFREYLGAANTVPVRRINNWIIFSIYTKPNTYYKYYSDEKYLGIFSNFFRLQSDD